MFPIGLSFGRSIDRLDPDGNRESSVAGYSVTMAEAANGVPRIDVWSDYI
jgi:hypothetical protein